MNYHVRISRSYEELLEFFDKCQFPLCVYEHPQDKEVSRTHVHALFMDVQVGTDTLKNWVKKALNIEKFPATDWMFETTYKPYKNCKKSERLPVNKKLITYMSKGKLEPKEFKIITKQEIDEYKSLWVDYGSKKPSPTNVTEAIETPKKSVKTNTDLIHELQLKVLKYKEESCEDNVNITKLIKFAGEVFRENKKCLSIYDSAKFIDSYYMWYSEVSWISMVERQYLKSRYSV